MADDEVPGMADAVRRRMAERGLSPTLFAEVAGVTTQGLDPVRAGARRNYSSKTRLGVARALGWPLDWYDRIIEGEPASKFETIEHADAPLSLPERVSALERSVRDLSDQVRQILDDGIALQ